MLIPYRTYVAYCSAVDEELPVTEARARFSELVNRVGFGKERIVLTRHGKPLVALVPAAALPPSEDGDAGEPVVLDLSSRPSSSDSSSFTIAARDSAKPPA